MAAQAAKAWQTGQSMVLTADSELARHLSDPSKLAAGLQQAASLPRDGAEGPTWHDLVANLETVDWADAIRCAVPAFASLLCVSGHSAVAIHYSFCTRGPCAVLVTLASWPSWSIGHACVLACAPLHATHIL